MKTTLLIVPSKKTEDVNWVKPLNSYLQSIYGNSSDYQQDLNQFHKLRQDIRGATADATGLKLYFQYFSQLELLDLRIPVTALNRHKSFCFIWFDAFLPTAEHKQQALPFEKASVLFNLGSLMTKAASLEYSESQRSSSTDDGSFKKAVQLLQQAAGVYTFLLANFLHAPSNDLNPTTVKFLVNLCLAESQEIFNLKVIDGDLEQKKNSLISKLCKSTSKHYGECFEACRHLLTAEGASSVSDHSTFAIIEDGLDDDDDFDLGNEESINEFNPERLGLPDNKVAARLDIFWVSTVQFKAQYYNSLAYYFHGLHLELINKFGEAIAYLTRSLELINEIPSAAMKILSKSGGESSYDMLDNYKYQKDALGIKLKDLTKDNDLIYHDIVPSTVTLADPKPMDSAKVIPMNKIEMFAQINEHNYNNFLKNVVPINIHELLSYYSEEKSQFLRNELDEVDVSNEELSSVLEYLKLPKALVTIKEMMINKKESAEHQATQLDPVVIGRVQEIALKHSQDFENRRFIDESKQEIMRNMNECESDLQKVSLSPSSGRFRDDLIKLKQTLYDASSSDSKLFALVDFQNSELYRILGRGSNSTEFRSLFEVQGKSSKPKVVVEEVSLLDVDDSLVSKQSDNIDGEITNIEDMLHDLHVLRANKGKLVDSLKSEIHKDDISDILMLNSKIKSTNEIKTVIFPEELKKFEVYLTELDALINKQLDLISALRTKWSELVSNPKVKEIQSSTTFQNNLIKEQSARINDFYDNNWKRYTGGLAKGVDFYKRLSQFSANLKRAIENEALQNTLSQSMTGLSIHSTGGSSSSKTQQAPNYYGQSQQGQNEQSLYFTHSRPRAELPSHRSGLSASHYAPQYAPLQPSLPVQTGQPQLAQLNYFQAGQSHIPNQASQRSGYESAPSLPPKRPSQALQNNTRSENSEKLIYEQPSAYQPNMYLYFLNNG